MNQSFITQSEDETISVGFQFGETLTPGSVVALFGDLGTGKTRLIKGLCKGLGVAEHVSSPTFTIVNEYHGKCCKIFHFDFYRMNSITELKEIGFDEYIYNDGVCVIEWADRVEKLLPPDRFNVFLKLGANENEREIRIEKIGDTKS
ncbi:MAG: tRNA (adenosine(37)-N6)-threonylcarbamoyltransferase complex ATPase subunit type 1 TsaE [Bacteroidota bacterium]|nr:tRNA (adenosine(37)-N6)-threonylcarbamoyltransferase complex ATPase subunit type 1 TsaE [Bacteroidota bacterium]